MFKINDASKSKKTLIVKVLNSVIADQHGGASIRFWIDGKLKIIIYLWVRKVYVIEKVKC